VIPTPFCDVLAVDDARVDVEPLAEARKQSLDRVAPGRPTTSPTKRIRTLRPRAAIGRRVDRDRDVVAALRRVRGERLLLDRGDVDRGAELRRAPRARECRRTIAGSGRTFIDGHHHRRRLRRA
jgi:hypothetical protein